MGSIALNYDSIYSAAKKAKKVASNAEDYVSNLQKKMINKIDELEGQSSAYASSAKGNTSDKITRLNTKKDAYTDYAKKLEEFVEDETTGVKAIDKRVAKMFKKDAEDFRDNNNLNINPVTQFFTFLACEFSNASDFARAISDGFTSVTNWLSDAWDSITDWYRYEGGKFWVNIGKAVLCIGLAIATIAVIVLTGGIGIVAICAIIGAGIAILDGLVTCGINVIALAKESNDPAWALKLSKNDKASTLLRKVDTGSGAFNNTLNFLAGGLDLIEAGCTVVTIVGSIADLGKKIPAIKNLIGDESKGLLKVLLDKSVRTKEGKAVVTFKSLKNGLKTLITNPDARKQILNKFKSDRNVHWNFATLKDTLRYQWKFGIKQTIASFATSPEARSRYANMLKVQVGKNTSKLWKDTIGGLTSGQSIDKAKGIKNIIKITKTGADSFSKSASSGVFDIVSMDTIKSNIKKTYFSMDSTANTINEGIKNMKDIKKNSGKAVDLMDSIKPLPAF